MKHIWTTPLVTVMSEEFDYDLKRFNVYRNGDAEYLGSVYPAELDAQQGIIEELNEGGCPIKDGWEDGAGNTCALTKWSDDNAQEIDLLPQERWDNKEMSSSDIGDHFFDGDMLDMHDALEPASDAMLSNTVRPDEDGLYDLDALDGQINFTQSLNGSELRRGGTAECLIPFLGRCEVAVEENIGISQKVAKVMHWIIERLKDEELPKDDKRAHAKELEQVIDRVISLDEAYVSGIPELIVTISKPTTIEQG